MKIKLLMGAAGVGWFSFWFWAFSFAYSDGFFLYNRHSRWPTFAAALICACVLPTSALLWWRQVVRGRRGTLGGLALHAVTAVAALALPFSVASILSRAPHPWRLEADDAMGVGIDHALLLLLALASAFLLGVALAVRGYRRHVALRPPEPR